MQSPRTPQRQQLLRTLITHIIPSRHSLTLLELELEQELEQELELELEQELKLELEP